jgi:hypothetical protein
LTLLSAVLALVLHGAPRASQPPAAATFASLSASLSEPDGYFDTDNLISNERSYLHVIPALRAAAFKGGAYIGVGPDQNFSYIAQARPSIAFIVDIRRDNLLLHLLFKALFHEAPTRVQYLCLLFGKDVPPEPADWRSAGIDKLVAYIDGASSKPASVDALRRRIDSRVKRFGIALTSADAATIDRFHRAFIAAGLSLKFNTSGRAPRSYYPTYRELLVERDREGRQSSFLANDADFQAVRALQQRDLVIPVVGNLGGRHALAAIGRVLAARGERLSVIYTSNVESYLFRDGGFARFIENLKAVPHTPGSLVIRAVFPAFGAYPVAMPGYYSASVTHPVDDLITGYASGKYRSPRDLAAAGTGAQSPAGSIR